LFDHTLPFRSPFLARSAFLFLISETHPQRPFQVRQEAERVCHEPSSVLKALHDDECIHTECILHFALRPDISEQRTIAVSSSFTARFASLVSPPETGPNSSVLPGTPGQQAEITDEALLTKVHAGDRDALSLLFRRYARPVRNVGRRIIRSNDEADDLVQEVFLYIHRKSALFDSSKGSARSWIVQVAYTQAFLRRRELKSQGFYLSGITDKQAECHPSSDKGAHYDHTVEGLFGRNGWKEIVEGLTEDQRETLLLHFFEDYTFTEIAEKLGQSFANVRHHHYRGLEKLRKYLADNELNRR
jgi:RNA polymerase sigma-70 factor, ECF subfamily